MRCPLPPEVTAKPDPSVFANMSLSLVACVSWFDYSVARMPCQRQVCSCPSEACCGLLPSGQEEALEYSQRSSSSPLVIFSNSLLFSPSLSPRHVLGLLGCFVTILQINMFPKLTRLSSNFIKSTTMEIWLDESL